MSSSTTVYILTPEATPLRAFGGSAGTGESDVLRLRYANGANQVGALELALRAGQLEPAYAQPDYLIQVTRSIAGLPERTEGDCLWLVRKITDMVSDGVQVITAESSLTLLEGREIQVASDSAQATVNGPADDVIKQLVRQHMGTLAAADRAYPTLLFGVEANRSAGPVISKNVAKKNVLQACQEIAADAAELGTPVFFDVVWTNNAFEFRTYLNQRGSDRSDASGRRLLFDADTLANVSVERDYTRERTVIYGLGRGTGSNQNTAAVTDTDELIRSPWARREYTVTGFNAPSGDAAALLAETRRTLRELRARLRMRADMVDSEQIRYGVEWEWGTRAVALVQGVTYEVRVDTREVELAQGQETVRAQLTVEANI